MVFHAVKFINYLKPGVVPVMIHAGNIRKHVKMKGVPRYLTHFVHLRLVKDTQAAFAPEFNDF
jgi:hypothetical protein